MICLKCRKKVAKVFAVCVIDFMEEVIKNKLKKLKIL